MKNINNYISNSCVKKLNEKEREKLISLDLEYKEIFLEFREHLDATDVMNAQEEWKKFKQARDKGEKYFPQFKLVVDDIPSDFVLRCRKLVRKFEDFNCYLSKFYVQRINELIIGAEYTTNRNSVTLDSFLSYFGSKPTEQQYVDAVKMIKKHKWQNVKEDQHWRGADVVPMLQKHIDELNYDYKATLNPCMVARMNVLPNVPALQIKTDAYFSDIDVESLKVHEVEVHCGRRYFGMEKGLYIMLDGFSHRNKLDEGLAIYNSIHKNPLGVKPNLFFCIAIKVIIGYHIYDKDFCELFDMLTEMCPEAPEFEIYKNIVRFKRILLDSSLKGGDVTSETDYLLGYSIVKNMSNKLKKDIIQYNIGPEHIKELPKLKKFFKINKFDKITSEMLPKEDPYIIILKKKGIDPNTLTE